MSLLEMGTCIFPARSGAWISPLAMSRSRSPLAGSWLMASGERERLAARAVNTLYSPAMIEREGSWWSRGWGAIALVALAVHLGAAVYEAAVIAPLWSLTPPASVKAWAALEGRPDSSALFQPLVAVIVVATLMAWISGISERGWRRWWLTLALACAGALAAVVVVMIMPCERSLFGAAALGERDSANVVALTGEWIRAAAFRLVALLVGAWAAYRAQLAGMLGAPAAALREAPPAGRRARDFAFGDEVDDEVTLGDEGANPRERWMTSLPRRRRTAKK